MLRVFTGEQFGEGPATVLVDQGKIVGVETRHVELDESWQLAERLAPPRSSSDGLRAKVDWTESKRWPPSSARPRSP